MFGPVSLRLGQWTPAVRPSPSAWTNREFLANEPSADFSALALVKTGIWKVAPLGPVDSSGSSVAFGLDSPGVFGERTFR